MIKTIVLIIFLIALFYFWKKKESMMGKYLPKILAFDKVLAFYFISAVLFAVAYCMLDFCLLRNNDKSLLTISDGHLFDYIYFSFITQLTLGYGDITPKFAVVRFLSIIQGIVGTILIGGIIASIVQYSSLLKVISVYISKRMDRESGMEIIFILKLNRNPTTIYENIQVKIFCQNGNNEVILAILKKNNLNKSKELVIFCTNEKPSNGMILTKDNKIYYEGSFLFGDEVEWENEEIYFEIEELFIELTYSIGTNAYTYKLGISQLDTFYKLLESKTGKILIKSKSLVVLQSY